jgi:II/X family phage/plasmid replication protein
VVLDTLRLASPPITEDEAQRIEALCVLKSATDLATGEELYALTTGSLSGSWDDRVSVRVEREEWHSQTITDSSHVRSTHTDDSGQRHYGTGREKDRSARVARTATYKRPCAPYLIIEGSVHKAMLGHNVYGGPLPPVLTACWFVDDVARRLGVPLPYAEDWRVLRVDWAEAYELPSAAACSEFVSGLNMAEFPRRKVIRFGCESLMVPSRTAAFKCYHKGPEFEKHDLPRLRQYAAVTAREADRQEGPQKVQFVPLAFIELDALRERASRILRFETSIKAQRLADDFEGKVTVLQLTETYLEETHDREADRLLKEGAAEMETVRTHLEVSRRLEEKYSNELARALFGTWMQFSALGERVVKDKLPPRTFYRQRKQLQEAGCSWHGADVAIVSRCSEIPAGFSPVRRDPRRLTLMADEVSYKLGTYDRA